MSAKNMIRAYFNLRAQLRKRDARRDAQLLRIARALKENGIDEYRFECNSCLAIGLGHRIPSIIHKPGCPVAEAEMIVASAEAKQEKTQ